METEEKQALIMKIKDCFAKQWLNTRSTNKTILVDEEGLLEVLCEIVEKME